MKKFFYLFFVIICFNCSDNTPINNCFSGITMDVVIDITSPEFNVEPYNLLVPGGYSINYIAGRDILILNLNNNDFRAFDLQCPERDCSSPMTYDGLLIECQCDGKLYNRLHGGAPEDGKGCSALMYFATPLSGNRLRISR
ncbi:hypothetical protein [Tenacibaculum sp. 47A_GOM-205m]|uniref:hypothetical protein n=1 Tax=Tenacibaculum sp. 47A_GOM-205m TaxID=1380384 RepID=UPI0004AEC833|nr:hypothetical protein [Tenacibaculum sp. 47A_GOM-205m]